ncbi:DUF2076 family protein [Oxalobacteraceae sp. CFBP 13730]|nr:DUF2076 family protein [Oxalobacteraceae sp. CFBP 13730]
MNPSDEKTLQDFLGQLVQARGVTKDPQADALIQRAVAEQPDAAYLLVQRALLVEQALGNAKARIAELERQTTKGSGGFLDANTWGNSAQSNSSTPAPVQGAAQGMAPSTRSGGFLSGAGGGMLGTIAATAAGVAAGSFLFHGIGNLLDHNDGGAGAEGGTNHLLADAGTGDANSGGALADQAGIGAIDERGAADDPLADSNHGDEPSGFFDGDGSDEGVFG